jgi:hypothetical protein
MLFQLTVDGDRAEAQSSKQNTDAVRFVHRTAEDYRRMTHELVDKVDEIGVFVLVRDDQEALDEGLHGLVRGAADGDADRV